MEREKRENKFNADEVPSRIVFKAGLSNKPAVIP